jgi:hypothetical protein
MSRVASVIALILRIDAMLCVLRWSLKGSDRSPFVMRGLDPRIQRFVGSGEKALDRRIKSGDDEKGELIGPAIMA